MGHRDDDEPIHTHDELSAEPKMTYLERIEWWEGFTLEDKTMRGPFQTQFGFGYAHNAASAVAAAKERFSTAQQALELVTIQAVAALADEGKSVRAIATELGLSKSEVGRIKRRGGPAMVASASRHKAVRRAVQTAWGHE